MNIVSFEPSEINNKFKCLWGLTSKSTYGGGGSSKTYKTTQGGVGPKTDEVERTYFSFDPNNY